MKTKTVLFTGTLFLLLIACSDNGEKQATEDLVLAREALDTDSFSKARELIDSIKILYPKAYKARKEGNRIMRQIELKEQQQGLAFLEKTLSEKQRVFEVEKQRFVLEKDAKYQETGNYFFPAQTVEKNMNRSYLRFQVDEHGVMSMTSIYCGAGNIHHTGVKVIAPDGSFAETPISRDRYETSDLGVKIEKVDYPVGQDGNAVGFIYLNRNTNIRAEYQGERNYTTILSATDRKAAAELYEFSQTLSSIEQIKKEIQETNMHIDFVKKNMERHE